MFESANLSRDHLTRVYIGLKVVFSFFCSFWFSLWFLQVSPLTSLVILVCLVFPMAFDILSRVTRERLEVFRPAVN